MWKYKETGNFVFFLWPRDPFQAFHGTLPKFSVDMRDVRQFRWFVRNYKISNEIFIEIYGVGPQKVLYYNIILALNGICVTYATLDLFML